MRKQVVVTLPGARDVRVLEARVVDLRHLLDLLPAGGDVDMLAHVCAHLPAILAVLSECITLPDGERTEDLTLSDAETILAAWWDLHTPFFGRALAALGLELAASDPSTPGATSTASSPPSASEASTGPGTGAGDTSGACLH